MFSVLMFVPSLVWWDVTPDRVQTVTHPSFHTFLSINILSSNTVPHICLHICLPVTRSPQPLCHWAAPVVQSALLQGTMTVKFVERGELCHFPQQAFHFKALTFQSQACLYNFPPLSPLLPLCKIISFHICSLLQLAPIVWPSHRLRIKTRLAFLHVLPVA